MIQAISNLPSTRQNPQFVSNVSFKGTPMGLVKDELVLSRKVSETTNEVAELISRKVRKLSDELPVTKKSKTAADNMDDCDDLVSGGAEALGDLAGDVVPFLGPGIRAVKAGNALIKGDMDEVGKQAGKFAISAGKQAVFGAISAATGPAAPITYVALNIGSLIVKKLFK